MSVERTKEKADNEAISSEAAEESGIVDPIVQAVRRLSSAAYDMVAGNQVPSSEIEEESWLELKGGDFAAVRDKLQTVVSLCRVGVWTEEERDDLLEKLTRGVIINLPESTYARYINCALRNTLWIS